MTDAGESETVERLIPAPPEAIFAFLVDPAKHRVIDGSGTVRDPKGDPPTQLALGAKFGMSMKMGLPYSMTSTVIELEENRCIAWQTYGPSCTGKLVGGRIWRYNLEPVDGGTLVKETWDYSQESGATKPFVRKGAADARKNMAATLERIEGLVS
jgi:uncharacterized protein YndB with AHSA1/START domain